MSKRIEIIDEMPVEVDEQRWASDRDGYIEYIRQKKRNAVLGEEEMLAEPEGFDEIGKSL